MFALVRLVVPRHATFNLYQVSVDAVHQHLAHFTPVAIGLADVDPNRFPEYQVRQALLGALAKRLRFLWRVNTGQSKFVLGLTGSQDCDGLIRTRG